MAIMRLVDAALRAVRPQSRYGYISPLLKQSKGIAWDYLKAYARQVPGTVINESELSVEFPNGARIRLFGADNPDSLRGLYFDGVVLDEVAQFALRVWGEIIMPALADREGFALFIGTPQGLNLFSTLYYKALSDPLWFAIAFTCYQTGALTPVEIEQQRLELTEAQFKQEMLCDFTASNENTLIPLDAAQAASGRHLREDQFNFAPRVMGVDVAWSGGDRSTIFGRQGLAAFVPKIRQGLPEKAFATVVAESMKRFKPIVTFIDTTGGYGGETFSRLNDDGHHVEAVVFSWKASSERFTNCRAEMWWKMAQWIKEGAAIPSDPGLLAELCTPTYSYDNASNRFALESKDDIRARLGLSPDLADALALTFFRPVGDPRPAWQEASLTRFDPFRDEQLDQPAVTTHDWNPLG